VRRGVWQRAQPLDVAVTLSDEPERLRINEVRDCFLAQALEQGDGVRCVAGLDYCAAKAHSAIEEGRPVKGFLNRAPVAPRDPRQVGEVSEEVGRLL
jgi:hypothetical protein